MAAVQQSSPQFIILGNNRKIDTMKIHFRKALEALQPYPPGKPIESVQREYGLSYVAKLASNENPYGPSPKALEAIAKEAPLLHLYPESNCYYLREKLAKIHGVEDEHLFFGNGSDEIVALLTMTILEDTDNIVCSEHSFIRYEMGATSMGSKTKHVPLKDWQHDVDALIAAIDDNTRCVFVANPENPIGSAISHTEIEKLLLAVPQDVLVILDEAYYEFAKDWADYPKSLELYKKHPNLVILRTFSKAYGLAGLRLGFAIGSPELWSAIDRIRPPFNVNRLAQAACLAALDDTDHLNRTIKGNSEGREYLYTELKRLNIEFVPSYTNFILMNMKRPALPVYEYLLRRGAIIRPMGIYKLPNHLRVSVGLTEENKFFIETLSQALQEL